MNNFANKIYAIASGKGGVGKTSLTASIGAALAAKGEKVILVDADLSGANLHSCIGILEPKYTLFDFHSRQINSLHSVLLTTPIKNLKLISGACGTLGMANQKYFQKQRFIRHFKKLSADYIILDLGSGASYNEIDFSLLADEKVLVVTPDPLSILEAFNFIKVSLLRCIMRELRDHTDALDVLHRMEVNRPGQLKFTMRGLLHNVSRVDDEAGTILKSIVCSYRPKLILNMLRKPDDVHEVTAIQTAAKELLSLNVDYFGFVSYDSAVGNSLKAFKPFLLHEPKSKAAQNISTLIDENFLCRNGHKEMTQDHKWWRIHQYF
ncbi:MAG: P-loop NTPase [bacterium]